MFQFDQDKRDLVSLYLLGIHWVIKAAWTRSTMYPNCAAIRRVLDYYCTVFKSVCRCAFSCCCLTESIINKSLKWGQYASAHITRANRYELMQNITNTPAYTCDCVHLMLCGCCFSLTLGGGCVSRGALWQAEAESSTLLSRTVQDKGPLPPVWG